MENILQEYKRKIETLNNTIIQLKEDKTDAKIETEKEFE